MKKGAWLKFENCGEDRLCSSCNTIISSTQRGNYCLWCGSYNKGKTITFEEWADLINNQGCCYHDFAEVKNMTYEEAEEYMKGGSKWVVQ